MATAATLYFCNRKSRINKHFSVYTLLASIWTILASYNYILSFWQAHIILIMMIVSSFLGTFFFLFGRAVANENYTFNKYDALWFLPPLFITIHNSVILFVPELLSTFSQSITIDNFIIKTHNSRIEFYLHSAVLLLGHVAGGIIIFRANKHETNFLHIKRNNIIMSAVLVGLGGSFVINNLFILLHRPAPIYWTLLFLAMAIIIIAYSLLTTRVWKLEDLLEMTKTDQKLLKKQIAEIELISCMDPLTKIYNRKMFYEVLDKVIARADRYKEPISLIIFDIDYFKKINDEYGHLVGDEVLVELSRLVQPLLRKNDLLVRWGGEEFIILAPHTTLNGATKLAEKIRNCISEHTFEKIGRLTCSFGVCQYNELYNKNKFLKYTDNALYRAKVLGRNRICTQTSLN